MLKIMSKIKETTGTITTEVKGIEALISYWKNQNENAEEIQLRENAQQLQLNFENIVAGVKQALNNAILKYEKAKRDAQRDADAQEIIEADLEVDIATIEYDRAVNSYVKLFGEKPRYA